MGQAHRGLYLRKTTSLRAVVALIDCRLTPQRLDEELEDWLRSPAHTRCGRVDQGRQVQAARPGGPEKRVAGARATRLPADCLFGKTGLGRESLCRVLAEAALSPSGRFPLLEKAGQEIRVFGAQVEDS